MASKEGIALLSMYNDEEEEEEEEEEENEEKQVKEEDGENPEAEEGENEEFNECEREEKAINMIEEEIEFRVSPEVREEIEEEEEIREKGNGLKSLTIVDYGHDETAMSPENEDSELQAGGRVLFGAKLDASEDLVQGRVSPSACQTAAATSSQFSPSSNIEQPDETIPNANEPTDIEMKDHLEQDHDILSNFLPPPVSSKCSEELQEKINKFLAYKKVGKSFNADLRNRKDYRNPDFLQHAVSYQDIDQHGTCFSKEIFDPHAYDKSDFYDAIEADMKREIERRDLERKRSPKVDFVSGGAQPALVIPLPKVTAQISAAAAAAVASAASASSAAGDAQPKEGRHSKKSKWDKVDTEPRLTSFSGFDAAASSTSASGVGYTAFAQQKRREAMEKSSDRKFDRRS